MKQIIFRRFFLSSTGVLAMFGNQTNNHSASLLLLLPSNDHLQLTEDYCHGAHER
ncbi:hypothetical protein DPMN_178268 [Dreissena polymorpha]|uniref:Uncharacterized protein n=1 Tax=Dreissena polymorpha TaxID=45954 RepID=A0A9D4EEP8_DREPO|nr:hypothetical protein DPMN_178268 [Dreissena polymorpha]